MPKATKKSKKDSALRRFLLKRTGANRITKGIEGNRPKRTGAEGESLGEIIGRGTRKLR